MSNFTHFNEQGRARMVDISAKKDTERIALARSSIFVTRDVYEKITAKEIEKGDVLAVAQVAVIMAANITSYWIPMCVPLQLKGVDINFEWRVVGDIHELMIYVSVNS